MLPGNHKHQNSESRPKFQNLDQITESLPNFWISTKFQNLDQISESQPNFRISTKFQNLDQISESRPNFRISTKFQYGNWPSLRVVQNICLFQSVSTLSGCVMKYKRTLPHYFLQFWYRHKLFFSWLPLKTLPEAQRTQGIESVTWIRFLTEVNLKTLFKSRTQYPGSVVPLAMFSTFFNFWFWNLVEILKFGRHFEIWPRLWNLV